uniref:Uncharacterized protein n=1 Tax=Knipowitschia caucasica TaxID=637954 RepID=A0AAV2JHW2_KNICA
MAARRYNEDTTRGSMFTYTNSNNTRAHMKLQLKHPQLAALSPVGCEGHGATFPQHLSSTIVHFSCGRIRAGIPMKP